MSECKQCKGTFSKSHRNQRKCRKCLDMNYNLYQDRLKNGEIVWKYTGLGKIYSASRERRRNAA